MDDRRQLWMTVHGRQTTVYERWLMDSEQQLWMTVMDGGRQFMEDGGGQSLVEHFAGNKAMYCAVACPGQCKTRN